MEICHVQSAGVPTPWEQTQSRWLIHTPSKGKTKLNNPQIPCSICQALPWAWCPASKAPAILRRLAANGSVTDTMISHYCPRHPRWNHQLYGEMGIILVETSGTASEYWAEVCLAGLNCIAHSHAAVHYQLPLVILVAKDNKRTQHKPEQSSLGRMDEN